MDVRVRVHRNGDTIQKDSCKACFFKQPPVADSTLLSIVTWRLLYRLLQPHPFVGLDIARF